MKKQKTLAQYRELKKRISLILILLISLNGILFSQYFLITKEVYFHINESESEFNKGAVAYSDFEIKVENVKKRKKRFCINGVINVGSQALPFVDFYIVEFTKNNDYHIVKKVEKSNFDGEFKFCTKLSKNQFIIVHKTSYSVVLLFPDIHKYKKLELRIKT